MIEISASDGPLTTEGIDGISSAAAPKAPVQVDSRKVRILKNIGWTGFGIFSLLLFTLLKLPEDRIKNYVQGMIASFLAPKGISFSAEKGYISVGWGISYVMKDVTLNFPPPDAPSHVDKISFTPSILPMILGYQGGSLWMYNGDGKLHASFSTKDTQISGTFSAKAMDLGKIGVLPLAAGIRGTAVVTGEGSVSGDFALPSTLTGDVDLNLSKVVIDQQSIMGFSVPRLAISEGKIELNSDKGKATVKTFRVGKPGSADDIQATGSGDVVLGRSWDSSTLNGKVNLKLSESVMKSFILIDALLGAGKQGDGSYSFQLNGPLTAPNPVPIAAGAPR
jgi:type II secretion system protein N